MIRRQATSRTGGSGISRRVLWVFVGIVVVTTAELAWWITFNVLSARQQRRAYVESLERERMLAADWIGMAARLQGVQKTQPARILMQHFPSLQWRPGPFAHPTLTQLYPGYGVFVQPDVMAGLAHKYNAHVRMFLSEGAFFLLMVCMGAMLIFRTMRYEVDLTRQQANFLSAVTHELKSPLTSLKLYVETMQLRDITSAVRSRYLRAMRSDVDRLETLVGNLLAVARLDAGVFTVHAQHVDLKVLLSALVQQMGAEMSQRGAPLVLEVPDESVFVRMDAGAFDTVVRNLLDNAAKYAGAAQASFNKGAAQGVRVRLRRQEDQAVLEVHDHGRGIALVEQPKIFQKFYRVGDEMVRQSKGSGLGLYLVAALVEQSGGRVAVRSPGMDSEQGTTFEVSLPLADRQAV